MNLRDEPGRDPLAKMFGFCYPSGREREMSRLLPPARRRFDEFHRVVIAGVLLKFAGLSLGRLSRPATMVSATEAPGANGANGEIGGLAGRRCVSMFSDVPSRANYTRSASCG